MARDQDPRTLRLLLNDDMVPPPPADAGARGWMREPLHRRYAPRTLDEVVGHRASIDAVRDLLAAQKAINCHGISGNGISTVVRIILSDVAMVVKHISCAMVCSELLRVLDSNIRNVLSALKQDRAKIVYLVRDIEILNRTDKATVLKKITEMEHVHVVVISQSRVESLHCVAFERPTDQEIVEHLYWIACEEGFEVDDARMAHISTYRNVRTCIMALDGPHVGDVRVACVDPYMRMLRAHETLDASLDASVELLCILSVLQGCEFSASWEWITDVFCDAVSCRFASTSAPTCIARHAQTCNRTKQLRLACKLLGVHALDMDLFGVVARGLFANGQLSAYPQTDADHGIKNRALYVLTKRNVKLSEGKRIRSMLKC